MVPALYSLVVRDRKKSPEDDEEEEKKPSSHAASHGPSTPAEERPAGEGEAEHRPSTDFDAPGDEGAIAPAPS